MISPFLSSSFTLRPKQKEEKEKKNIKGDWKGGIQMGGEEVKTKPEPKVEIQVTCNPFIHTC